MVRIDPLHTGLLQEERGPAYFKASYKGGDTSAKMHHCLTRFAVGS